MFLCCDGCTAAVEASPDKYLAKLPRDDAEAGLPAVRQAPVDLRILVMLPALSPQMEFDVAARLVLGYLREHVPLALGQVHDRRSG